MVLRVEKEVVFKLQVAMWCSMDFDDSCYAVDNTDKYMDEFVKYFLINDGLENLFEEEAPLGKTNQDDAQI